MKINSIDTKTTPWFKLVSIVLIIIGIILALHFYFFRFPENCTDNCNSFYSYIPFLSILFTGLIIFISDDILGKIIKKKAKEYAKEFIKINNKKNRQEIIEELKKDENLQNIVLKSDILNQKINDTIEYLNLENLITTDESNNKENDTILVPYGLTKQWVLDFDFYFFPKSRKTIDKKYIAFYASKNIDFVAEIDENCLNNSDEIESILGTRLNEFVNEFGNIEDQTFIKFSNPIRLNIVHKKNYAFVQNKRYLNRDKLLKNIGGDTDSIV